MPMKKTLLIVLLAVGIGIVLVATLGKSPPTSMHFKGSHYDIGGTFFPGYAFPQNSIVPWRTKLPDNVFDSDGDGDDHYGTAGYILFATRFDFPDANPNGVAKFELKPAGDFRSPEGHNEYPNLVDLPDFISNWEILSSRMAGGGAYALIDDPRLQRGPRYWTFDGKSYPLPTGENGTGTVPFVKLGVLYGPDRNGNDPQQQERAARWAFTLGSDIPQSFRLGVMTDGETLPEVAPSQVFLQRSGSDEIVSSNELKRNRFVDIHFFDILYAKPGDTFTVSATSPTNGAGAGVAGFSFDINPAP